jgi:hypothetical protein
MSRLKPKGRRFKSAAPDQLTSIQLLGLASFRFTCLYRLDRQPRPTLVSRVEKEDALCITLPLLPLALVQAILSGHAARMMSVNY